MRPISFRGVVVGGVTDVLATFIVTLLVGFYVLSTLDLSGIPQDRVGSAISSALRSSVRVFSIQTVLGGACSVLGGYVAARTAKRNEVLNGSLSSFLCLVFGSYSLVSGTGAECIPRWLHVALLPLSPVCGALGGFLRAVQIRPSDASTPPRPASG